MKTLHRALRKKRPDEIDSDIYINDIPFRRGEPPLSMSIRRQLFVFIAFCAIGFLVCQASAASSQPGTSAIKRLTVTSTAFINSGMIPSTYTCDGVDISPPISWSGAPARVKSFALLVTDPDASGFTHWIIFNIPATSTGLSADIPNTATLADGSRQGKNSFGGIGYAGPCPPSLHRYSFKVYALDRKLPLTGTPSKSRFLRAIKGHVIGQGSIIGKYG